MKPGPSEEDSPDHRAAGHSADAWAESVGISRSFGFGASVCAWIVDYLAGWAGHDGVVLHHQSRYLSPVLSGDIAILTGVVADAWPDACPGYGAVQVRVTVCNQDDTRLAEAAAEILLPADADNDAAGPA